MGFSNKTNTSNILKGLKREGRFNKFLEDLGFDPFVYGFSYTIIELPPAILNFNSYINKEIPGYADEDILYSNTRALNLLLELSLLGINGIPDYQLNRENVIAGYSTKGTVELNIQNDIAFTLNFIETQAAIISKFITSWISIIRHPIYGISRLAKGKYSTENFSANILHAVFQPNFLDIENIVYLSGVRPDRTVHNDLFSANVVDSGLKELQISMVCDTAYINDEKIYKEFMYKFNDISNNARMQIIWRGQFLNYLSGIPDYYQDFVDADNKYNLNIPGKNILNSFINKNEIYNDNGVTIKQFEKYASNVKNIKDFNYSEELKNNKILNVYNKINSFFV